MPNNLIMFEIQIRNAGTIYSSQKNRKNSNLESTLNIRKGCKYKNWAWAECIYELFLNKLSLVKKGVENPTDIFRGTLWVEVYTLQWRFFSSNYYHEQYFEKCGFLSTKKNLKLSFESMNYLNIKNVWIELDIFSKLCMNCCDI